MATNKNLFEYIKNSIAERFRSYPTKKPYCFSIILTSDTRQFPDIKIAVYETGAEKFLQRFEEAIRQGKLLKADNLIIREYEDPRLGTPPERLDMKQELKLKDVGKDETVPANPRKKKEQSQGLGLADVQAMVNAGTEKQRQELEIARKEMDHEREVEKLNAQIGKVAEEKEKQIKELTEELQKTKAIIEEKDTEIAEKETEIEQLESQIEEEKGKKWAIDQIPLGQILSDGVTHFLRKNPAALSGFGVPAETLKGLLSGGDEEQPAYTEGASKPTPANAERTQYYDGILTYCESLNNDEFGKLLQIIVAMQDDKSKLDTIVDLVKESLEQRSA